MSPDPTPGSTSLRPISGLLRTVEPRSTFSLEINRFAVHRSSRAASCVSLTTLVIRLTVKDHLNSGTLFEDGDCP